MGRYATLTSESMNLLVGNYGKTPGTPNPELVKQALKGLGMEKPVTERPADLLSNELPKIEEELRQKLGVASGRYRRCAHLRDVPAGGHQVLRDPFQRPGEVRSSCCSGSCTCNRQHLPNPLPLPLRLLRSPPRRQAGASSYVVNVDSKDFKVVCEFKFELQKVDSGS